MACQNVKECACPKKECANNGKCCACAIKHRETDSLPFCLFLDNGGDKSLANFYKTNTRHPAADTAVVVADTTAAVAAAGWADAGKNRREKIPICHAADRVNGQSYKTIALNRRCQDEKYIAHYDRLVSFSYSLSTR